MITGNKKMGKEITLQKKNMLEARSARILATSQYCQGHSALASAEQLSTVLLPQQLGNQLIQH